ncbi:MAG: trypsin-like peptidase domain-containing protein [Oscillatoriaceae bacterium SKW80]|nr:trypsin-like peptidase domain-containing protein [Oscillatoriaceae bacterium SKYG93]MCX8119473.1 trypsin-like peptidase domain-containing protein [Oscillatoriaceae bacterium SKW80]MDW8454939.1 HhoA/HhoB/HtrA family serine endopeptidase [Oscillatoriaceae cyanobacterium SKYGB_i_bin93]HIK28283.1 trypsin-like peptidase domain-containing protein [Oscillatoriaceae cyanobacterium M7585_C2015_266]
MSSLFKQLTVYISLLAIGGSLGLLGSRYLLAEKQDNISETEKTALRSLSQKPTATPVANLVSGHNSNFITAAVEKVGPAVVRIDASRKVSAQLPETFDNPFFRYFFGDDLPIPSERIQSGTGSGLILISDGHLLTNAHVIDGADVVQVTLKDGRSFQGRVLGSDPLTDVAVVKIDATDLPTAVLGNSNNLVPGQWAIAIGNPLGLDNTVTVGIISATGRSSSQVGIPDKRVRFIQTDAAINPGNSGGPLLNEQGEVIGINTAIRANAQGLGFAIPIETAKRIADSLIATGKVEHPYLGIQMINLSPIAREEINEQMKNDFKITQDKGVLIVQVIPNSPAQKAGLRRGDIIQKIEGKEINTTEEVQDCVEASAVGEVLQLQINRNGQQQKIAVRTGAYPSDR